MLSRFASQIVDQIRPGVARVESHLCRQYGRGLIADEEDFTSRLLQDLQHFLNARMDGFLLSSLAVTLNKRKEEPQVGADALVLTHYDFPEYRLTKGFLVQAKRLEDQQHFSSTDWTRLLKQCERMELQSSASFVWLYGTRSIRVNRASLLSGLTRPAPDLLAQPAFADFLTGFLLCRYGDAAMSLGGVPRLQRIVEELSVGNVLLVSLSSTMESPVDRAASDGDSGGGLNIGEILDWMLSLQARQLDATQEDALQEGEDAVEASDIELDTRKAGDWYSGNFNAMEEE